MILGFDPWYMGAVDKDGVFWTGIYIFFTDHKPGVTVFQPGRLGRMANSVSPASTSRWKTRRAFVDAEIGRLALIMDSGGHSDRLPPMSPRLAKRDKDDLVLAPRDEDLATRNGPRPRTASPASRPGAYHRGRCTRRDRALKRLARRLVTSSPAGSADFSRLLLASNKPQGAGDADADVAFAAAFWLPCSFSARPAG